MLLNKALNRGLSYFLISYTCNLSLNITFMSVYNIHGNTLVYIPILTINLLLISMHITSILAVY